MEREMEKVIEKMPRLAEDAKRFGSIYGVWRVTALRVLAELGDLRRLERSRQLTAFAGLPPRCVESGRSVCGRSRMCKKGSSHVRSALHMSALTVIRGDNAMAEKYRAMVAAGRAKRSAMGAVMM